MITREAGTFFLKLGALFAPFILLALLAFTFIDAPASTKIKYLNDKIQRLVVQAPERPQIIIAGDSRAEMNVMPNLLSQELGTSSVNIGVGLGIATEVAAQLRANNALNNKSFILLSVSSYQIDDGDLTDDDPIDAAIIAREPFSLQKAADAQQYISNLYDYYFNRFKTFFRPDVSNPEKMSGVVLTAKGYTEKTGLLAAQQDAPGTTAAGAVVRTGGLKQQAFVQALQTLGQSDDTVLIYESPYAPAVWAQQKNALSPAEEKFRAVINQAIAPYPNMHFVDFELDGPSLPDNDFADAVHLNHAGAEAFTKLLAQVITQEKLLR